MLRMKRWVWVLVVLVSVGTVGSFRDKRTARRDRKSLLRGFSRLQRAFEQPQRVPPQERHSILPGQSYSRMAFHRAGV